MADAKILRTLADMAERLGLSSNQAILLYTGNNFWLSPQMSEAAFAPLRKLAEAHKIDLFDFEEPFIVTLAKKGVFTPDECRLFGWRIDANAGNGTAAAPTPATATDTSTERDGGTATGGNQAAAPAPEVSRNDRAQAPSESRATGETTGSPGKTRRRTVRASRSPDSTSSPA